MAKLSKQIDRMANEYGDIIIAQIQKKRQQDAPVHYYDKIDNPLSKKDDILSYFKDYTIDIHYFGEEEYDYLEEGNISIVIRNPNSLSLQQFFFEDRPRYGNDFGSLEFVLGSAGERFVMYFGGAFLHFNSYEYDFEVMISTGRRILTGEVGAVCIMTGNDWHGGAYVAESLTTDDILRKYVIDELDISPQLQKDLCENDAVIYQMYWNVEDCKKIKL